LAEIEALKKEVEGGRNPKDAKVMLAKEITARFHSTAAADAAEQDFINRSQGGVPDQIPEVTLSGAPMGVAALLNAAGLVASNGEGNRLIDGGVKAVITADGGFRKDKAVALKPAVDQALADGACPTVEQVLVVRRTEQPTAMVEGRDRWWHELVEVQSADCPAEPMASEDRLFVLYTSGSTGKPKGVVHTTAGYNLWAHLTFQWIFDIRDDDVHWCTADVGWITGHSYIVYGPLSNGATTVMYEGAPRPSKPGAFWEVIQKHRVTLFYTAPTAIRAFMKSGREVPDQYDMSSLRILGTVGEPINPEAWMWYREVIGHDRCPVIDTWWQTETGGCMITTLPGAHDMKPGSAGLPFFGIRPQLVDSEGGVLDGAAEGNLCITHSWPGQARTIYGDHERFGQTYFSTYKAKYFTGDGCKRDADGYYWITGRVDDVINVSGHRMGTAEVESALVLHSKVAEAAVVGYPHDIKGQGIYCYVTLNAGEDGSDALLAELKQHVRKEIGPIATPDIIHFTDGLPKTRSGKIMRRILRKIAENEFGALGDTSTLADPSLVDRLIEGRQNG
jgi:acetyl-CoA synthetase